MNQEEWIISANTRVRGFLRPGSVHIYPSIEGHGDKPSVSAYPNQGLDIATEEYDYPWLAKAAHAAEASQWGHVPVPRYGQAGYCKYQGEHWRTPLGTPVAELTRTGGDYLASPCGYCGKRISKCKCDMGYGTERD